MWRELLAFGFGDLAATVKQFPHTMPGRPWQHRPEPGTDADADQAIAAKLHRALHTLPLLAEADVVVIEPPVADLIPDCADGYHVMLARLLRSGAMVAQTVMQPENQRDTTMMLRTRP